MKKIIAVLIALLILGVAVPAYFLMKTGNELSETRLEKMRVTQELETVITTTENMLAETRGNLNNTEQKLMEANRELNTVKQELFTAEQKLVSLDQMLEKMGQEAAGYAATLKTLIPQKNPTYQELKEFLDKDGTNQTPYVPGKYVCLDFAAALDNAAEKAGIRAGYVFLTFRFVPEGKWGHTVNVFETSDRGLIYIEPRSDLEIQVGLGLQYMETIQEIIIAW